MQACIVVAMNGDYIIGRAGKLPWQGQLPADMDRFRKLTMSHPVIMGRKTYESIKPEFRPLRGRTNIVLTRQEKYDAPGCIVLGSMESALAEAGRLSQRVFIIGGADVYLAGLSSTNEIHLTLVHETFPGDARFPVIDQRVWHEIMEDHEDHNADGRNKYPYSFLHLVRR